MTMQIFECEQNSPEWYAARLGIPTASMYKTVLASGKSGGESLTRTAYMHKLAGEIVTGESMENYTNANMERGKIMEDEAREYYGFLNDVPLKRVGFIRNGETGCSPDSLIGDRGMLEIKTAQPNILIGAMMRGKFPAEHVAQCQGGLMCAEREWIDIVLYWPKMPLFTMRAQRDEPYILGLSQALAEFNGQLAEIVAKVRGWGLPKLPKAHRHWSELSLPEQAGIRCQDVAFHKFLYADHFQDWFAQLPQTDSERAACAVRDMCGVKSRAELRTDDEAGMKWIELNRGYEAWRSVR